MGRSKAQLQLCRFTKALVASNRKRQTNVTFKYLRKPLGIEEEVLKCHQELENLCRLEERMSIRMTANTKLVQLLEKNISNRIVEGDCV